MIEKYMMMHASILHFKNLNRKPSEITMTMFMFDPN